MPPKKTSAGAKKAAPSSHAPYLDMIKEAVIGLKERSGSSRQALKKYVQANNNLGGVTDAQFTTQFNRALQKGSESGVFSRPKGASGPVKLAAPAKAGDKPAAAKSTTTKAKAEPKAAAAKKAPAAKKTATKAKAKVPAAKKTATKAKAPAKGKSATTTKAKKAPKAPVAAPAVSEEKPTVLGKTKSGRVTKTTQPASARPTKATTKKAPAKKAAAKKATPKKA